MTHDNDLVSRAELLQWIAGRKDKLTNNKILRPSDEAMSWIWLDRFEEVVRSALTTEAGDESGFGGETIGKQAIGHLREMYRPAFDALGPSGRVSLRNYIDSRVRCAPPATEGEA